MRALMEFQCLLLGLDQLLGAIGDVRLGGASHVSILDWHVAVCILAQLPLESVGSILKFRAVGNEEGDVIHD